MSPSCQYGRFSHSGLLLNVRLHNKKHLHVNPDIMGQRLCEIWGYF